MRIRTVEFRDKHADWNLSTVEFFPDLTLLVGVSGVGKTRILRALSTLREIARVEDESQEGRGFWGLSWNISFVADDAAEYTWIGEFEDRVSDDREVPDDWEFPFSLPPSASRARAKILREELSRNGISIIARDTFGIRLRGNSTPRLSPYQSVMNLLAEEDEISAASRALMQVLVVDHSIEPSHENALVRRIAGFDRWCERHVTIDAIRNSVLPTTAKLAIARRNVPDVFQQVKDRFREIFPYVEDIDVHRIQAGMFDSLQLRLRERGVSTWIPEHRISSGMLRTLMYLSRMALWPDGMVVLIDEFENSLGVNCIDVITDDLVRESRRQQFIITSHHPYIINNIDSRHWKIVCRDGSTVSVRNASEFDIQRSKHEAFLKLMNLPEYQEGIVAG